MRLGYMGGSNATRSHSASAPAVAGDQVPDPALQMPSYVGGPAAFDGCHPLLLLLLLLVLLQYEEAEADVAKDETGQRAGAPEPASIS